MSFSDDFTGDDDDLLHERSGWTRLIDATGDFALSSNAVKFGVGGGGSNWEQVCCTDQADADQYLQITDILFTPYSSSYVVLRADTSGNFIAYHLAGTGGSGARIGKMLSWSFTDSLITWQGWAGAIYRITVDSDNLVSVYYYSGGWNLIDSVTIDEASINSNTRQGFISNVTMSAKWDDFEAGTLGGAGGPSGVKTIEGLAIASVKTIEGLAIASVKSMQETSEEIPLRKAA